MGTQGPVHYLLLHIFCAKRPNWKSMFNVRLDLEYWPGGPIAAKLTKTSFFYRSVLLPGTYFDNVPLKYRALDLTSWPVFLPCPSSFVNVIHQERIIKYTINTVTKVPLSQSISLSKWMNLHKVFLFRVRLLGRRRLYSGSTNRRRFFTHNCEKRERLKWPDETVWVLTSVKMWGRTWWPCWTLRSGSSSGCISSRTAGWLRAPGCFQEVQAGWPCSPF